MDFYEDDIEYQDVFTDLERATFGQLGVVGAAFTDAEDMFTIKVDAIARDIKGEFSLTGKDISFMIEKSKDIPFIQYKNAEAYVLGYIASNGGTNLNKPTVSKVFKMLSSYPNVKEEDVVRYGRLWMNLI